MNLGSTFCFICRLDRSFSLTLDIVSSLSPSFPFLSPLNSYHPPSLLAQYLYSSYVLHFLSISHSRSHCISISSLPPPPVLNLRFISVSSDFYCLSTAQCGSWVRKVCPHPTLPLVLVCPGPKTRSGEMNGILLCFQI